MRDSKRTGRVENPAQPGKLIFVGMSMQNLLFTDCVDLVGMACTPFDGTRKYVSTGAVDTDRINEADVEIVDYLGKPSRANLVVSSGDVLFAKMQGTKKTLLIDEQLAHHIYSTGFCAVHARSGLLTNRCLYHILSSQMFLAQKDKNCSGATQKAITNAGLEKIQLRVPDINEQDRIADQLDSIVSILEKRQKQLSALDDFIKARFVEMFGDPVQNEKGWQTKALEDACKSIVDCPHSTPSYTSEDTGFMCIRTSIVKKNRIMWEDIEYIPEEEYIQRIQRKKPEKGDVVYTREGAILGIAAVIDRDCNVALGQRSMLLSPDRAFCTPEFISVAMNFDSFLDNALKGMSGSASPHINVGDIKAFKMILPPIAQQEAFSTFVAQIDKSKSVIQKSLDETQLLFDSLMQQYFG